MTDKNASFTGSIPEQYDRYMGPLFFVPYAKDLVARLPRLTTGTVLEVACGTGIVTEQLRKALPSDVRVVATDLNEPMLVYARTARRLGAGVEWEPADAQALPFPDASVDVVVCQFGLMFVPDKEAALREARRVLKPGGTLALSVWAGLSENPIGRIPDEVIRSIFPDDPPGFYRVPFSLGDEGALRRMLTNSGFEVTTAEWVTLTGFAPSAADVARGWVYGTPMFLAIQERGTVSPEAIVDALSEALATVGGREPFSVPMRALVVVARAV